MIEPAFAARSYTPLRITLMPPDVFVVIDQVGANDPVASAALGQAVSAQTVHLVTQGLRSRGYDVDLSARWDGIVAQDGSLLVTRDELGWMANSVLQFANGPEGGGEGPMTTPRFVAPELAARVGWATQSDALMYVNIKGVTTTPGKRTASVIGALLIVFVIAAIILMLVANSKGGGNSRGSSPSAGGGNWRGQPVMRGSPPAGGGMAGSMPSARPPVAATPPRGRGFSPPPGRSGGRVYGGPRVGVGVGVYVPLGGPTHTHEGTVTHDDAFFAGDELYISMTLVSAVDGRVLWHVRNHLDLEADKPQDIQRMVDTLVGSIPLRGGL
jgi:hypothetical protein